MHPFPPYPPSRSPFSAFQPPPPQSMHAPFRMPHQAMQAPGDPLNRLFGAIGTGGIPARTSVFSMLDNVQKVLKVAETMGPMVKQYGPMMRNLPSLMTMLKDYQNGSAAKDENTEAEGENNSAPEAAAAPADNSIEPGQEAAVEKTVIAGPAANRKSQKKTKTAAAASTETEKTEAEDNARPSFRKNKLAASGKSQSLFKKKKIQEDNEEAVKHEEPVQEIQDITAVESQAASEKQIAKKFEKEGSQVAEIKPLRPRPKKISNSETQLSKPKLYI